MYQPTGNPPWRPTKYNQEITLNKAIEYCQRYEELGEVIPSIAGLAVFLEITRETVHDWVRQEDKQDFSYIVKKILALQEIKLSNSGLKDDFNASITKLLLTKHGYSDRQEFGGIEGKDLKIIISQYDNSPTPPLPTPFIPTPPTEGTGQGN